MVLYRFGSTGVVQVLSRAAELLGLVPVFPVRNVTTFSSGASHSNAVFRDCVLVKKGTTVADVGRKVMGDAPLAYVEGVGGVRVAEDDLVGVGKNDVCLLPLAADFKFADQNRSSHSKSAEHKTRLVGKLAFHRSGSIANGVHRWLENCSVKPRLRNELLSTGLPRLNKIKSSAVSPVPSSTSSELHSSFLLFNPDTS